MLVVYKVYILLGASVVVASLTYGAIQFSPIDSSASDNMCAPIKRPHIVFIIVDDMGWNDVSFHGANQIPTPNIDALAYNGVILNRHYVLPICTPSRTALLTGRYPIKEGMQGMPLRAGEPRGIPLKSTLLPEYLRNLGYTTRLVGKWHVGYLTEDYTPARRGFDSFFGYYSGYLTFFDAMMYQELADGEGIYGYDLHRDDPQRLNVDYNNRSEYFTDLITDEAVRIIRNNKNDEPLFLEIAHLAVHTSGLEDEPLQVRNLTAVNENFPHIENINRRKYADMMKTLDESVGRVVKALSESSMLENSIIVFVSDNGAPTIGQYSNEGSNYPLRGIKNTLFEGGVRGAACIFSPLIEATSRVSDHYMHIVDWLPTLYSAAGGDPADLGDNLDGSDHWPSIVQGGASPRTSLLLNIDEETGVESAIIGRHKLIKGASDMGEGFYGDTGNGPSYSYNVEDVLSSDAGLAISNLTGFVSATPRKIQRLRKTSTVRCKPVTSYPNCSTHCLFDVRNDPCETRDVSDQHPGIVHVLEQYIDSYRRFLMPQTNAPVDPCSLPKFFNGTWMPWMTNDVPPPSDSSNTCHHPIYDFLL